MDILSRDPCACFFFTLSFFFYVGGHKKVRVFISISRHEQDQTEIERLR